jgi:hypothetical protein
MVAIFYYSTDFFLKACIVKEQAQYATIGVGAIMVVMTLVTIPLMDRAGRRTLHLVSSAKRLKEEFVLYAYHYVFKSYSTAPKMFSLG